jgi:hypothetical protein
MVGEEMWECVGGNVVGEREELLEKIVYYYAPRRIFLRRKRRKAALGQVSLLLVPF